MTALSFAAVKHFAVIEHPLLWFAAVMAVLCAVVRKFDTRHARIGVVFILLGVVLNLAVIRANGAMPVMGMGSIQPINSTWQAGGPDTKFPFLADQAGLSFFSIGDIVLLVGGLLFLLHRVPFSKMRLGFSRLVTETTGQDVAEYAMMLAVILIIVYGTVQLIGGKANNVFSAVGNALGPQ